MTQTTTIHRAPVFSNPEDRAIAEAKLKEVIARGRAEAKRGIEALHREYEIRNDIIVKPKAIDIELRKVETKDAAGKVIGEFETWAPVVSAKRGERTIYEATGFARGQLLNTAKVPQRFAETLMQFGEGDLLRETLRRILPKTAPDGLLVREVGGLIKGVLSPSYRRMDASPIFQSYFETSMAMGFVPRTGKVTDTRSVISFIKPEIIDVGDLIIFGHSLRTSDYGNGSLELDAYIERLRCLNGLIGYDMLRKVHLGRRFDGGEDAVVELSKATIELDAKTVVSALKDVLKGAERQLTGMTEALREKVESDKLDLTAALDGLKRKGLKAATIEKVKATYENEALPVEALPKQGGAWRLANALSLLANDEKVPGDESLALQDAAWEALNVKITKKAA